MKIVTLRKADGTQTPALVINLDGKDVVFAQNDNVQKGGRAAIR